MKKLLLTTLLFAFAPALSFGAVQFTPIYEEYHTTYSDSANLPEGDVLVTTSALDMIYSVNKFYQWNMANGLSDMYRFELSGVQIIDASPSERLGLNESSVGSYCSFDKSYVTSDPNYGVLASMRDCILATHPNPICECLTIPEQSSFMLLGLSLPLILIRKRK